MSKAAGLTFLSSFLLVLATTALGQEVLPQPEQPFKGKIGRTAKDSTPDFPKGVEAPEGAPNVLLVVPGRRSGVERATPVGVLDIDGHSYVQATYGAGGWARNLRAAGEATVIHSGGRRSPVHAIEISPEEAAAILRHALEPYRQLRLLRRLLGARVRPPAAVLRRYRIRVDDTPQEYLAEARRHPLFELRPA